MRRTLSIWSALIVIAAAAAGCDSGREASSEASRREAARPARQASGSTSLEPGSSERPAPDSPPVPPGEPAGSTEPGAEDGRATGAANDSTREAAGLAREMTGPHTPAEGPSMERHGVEKVPGQAPTESDLEIPLAPMGHKKGVSALAGAPGYIPPDVPEAASLRRGRREVPRRSIAFSDGQPSGEDLARAILAALRTGEPSELHRLRVTKQEFSEILWPEMPQSRPITNTRAKDAWFFVDADNHAGINSGVSDWGGQDLELVRLRYETGRAPYTNFTLYRGVRIVARPPGGEEVTLDFIEAFAECGGLWKVYCFKD